jgi:Tfp pilus assembly protein PilO
MNLTIPQNIAHWPRRAKYVVSLIVVAAMALVAFGFYTGDPVFFLKWFFGLQADD